MDNGKTTKTATVSQRPPAPAIFVGYLADNKARLRQPLELWNLTEDIPGHPQGSTVSRKTLEKAGYAVLPPSKASRRGHGFS